MNLSPGVVLPLVISLALYLVGVRRLPERQVSGSRARQGAFIAGWTALAIALVSPIHELGEQLFSAHMAQHEILMVVAAPLLIWSRPLAPTLRGLPVYWRAPVVRALARPVVRRVTQTVSTPAIAFVLHGLAIWVWHAPALFQATLRSESVHALQHLSFFITALLFWWSLLHGRRGQRDFGLALLSVFLTTLHTGALGALLALSTGVYYPAYAHPAEAWGLSPLEDQQLGGLIMWVPGGIAYLLAALALGAAWLRESERLAVRGDAQRAGREVLPAR